MASFAGGKDEIHDGDAWATLLFENNYTLNVIQRYLTIPCSIYSKNFNS